MNKPHLSSDMKSPHNKTIHQLFEDQVAQTPDNIAVVYEDKHLTYQELNAKANQLAYYLINHYKINPDDLIALCLDRNEYMLIAMLGTLKAGAAYVPMDPSYPDERIKHILQDTKTQLVLTNEVHTERLEVFSDVMHTRQVNLASDHIDNNLMIGMGVKGVLAIDSEILKKQLLLYPNKNKRGITKDTNLAYVIYTSGTEGKPKGVMIEHGALINKLRYLIDVHEINATFTIAAKIPYTFDPSLREIFLALLSGAKLALVSERMYRDVMQLVDYCIKMKITLVIFVPSHLAEFIFYLKELSCQQLAAINIKILYSCGEALQKKLVVELKNYLPNIIIKNQYGPTECCSLFILLNKP